ncbi:zinc finger protein ZFP2-like [Cloeon dipterum]|uniref:zinc finger protein ZFP2-like n=1 Tax=Cloeon dipterum TaxID=197152 RepID=UPI00321FD106
MVDYAVEVCFTDLCRICANPCHASRRITLFGPDSARLKLLEKINTFLPSLTICENDGYPNFACILCVSRLTVCDNLVNLCKEANERLRALKTQLEFEKNSRTAESGENYSSNANEFTEAKEGSFEMVPETESAKISVILRKELPKSSERPEQSLVLVNVPSERLQKAKENCDPGSDKQTLLEKVIKSGADSEVSNALKGLTSKPAPAASENVRRSSRARVRKRFFETDASRPKLQQKEEQHHCDICDVSFNNLKKLLLHQRSRAHNLKSCAKNMKCAKCRQAFESSEQLEAHACNPLKCDFCKVVFDNAREQEQHSLLHDGNFTCDMCDARFSELQVLQNHILCHTLGKRKKLHQCRMCAKLFKSRLGLINHESNHTDQRAYSCYICSLAFPNKEEMLEHRRQHTREEKVVQQGERPRRKKQQPCSVCQKVLASKAGLEVHMRMHKNEKPFECSECGKLFRQEIKLRYHLRIHLGDLPYCCATCGKRFNTQRQLDTHTRVHTNERPYICEVCGLGFRSSGVLGRHKNTHSEEPLFACCVCEKKFRTRHATTTHERTHATDKGFMCDLCGRTFAQKVTLEKHRQRHDKQRVSCVECNVSFASKKGLRRHFDKKHPVALGEHIFHNDYVTLTVPNDELIVEVVV